MVGKRNRGHFMSRKSTGDVVFDVFNAVLMLLFSFSILYPFWSEFLLSFSDNAAAQAIGFHFWIDSWDLSAYRFVFHRTHIGQAYFNSIYRAVVGTVLTVMVTMFAAYPLADRRLPGRGWLTIVFLFTMFFNGGLIPRYLLVRNLGLVDTRWSLILPMLVTPYYIVIMRNFLMTIDPAYRESAYLDGANEFQIFFRIVVPLAKPVIATVALWTAVRHWNSWFDALLYIRDDSKIVLQLLLRKLVVEADQNMDEAIRNFRTEDGAGELPTVSVKAAVTLLTIGPIVFAYPFLQKYFIKGIFIGSLKG